MKERLSKRNVLAASAILLSSVAFMGCSEKESKGDKGSNEIAECPQGYAVGAREVKGSREEFRTSLGSAVTSLAAVIPRNGSGQAVVTYQPKLSLEDKRRIAAGVEVFHQESLDSLYDVAILEINRPENRVDDLSEQFCKEGNKLYVAPQAATAIGAMEAAGIKVER
jgi:CRISPR/Cas system CMR-associated protein Cmr5 small subunit